MQAHLGDELERVSPRVQEGWVHGSPPSLLNPTTGLFARLLPGHSELTKCSTNSRSPAALLGT